MNEMNMSENSRVILALRAIGWTDTQINDLVLYVETGDQQFLDELKKLVNA